MLLRWREDSANPITPAQRPNRYNFSFTKKVTPSKRSKSDNKRVSKKQHTSRNIEGCYVPTKAVMSTFMLSPAIVAMTPIVPKLPASPKAQVSTATNSCQTCKCQGKPCPMYTTPAPPSSPSYSDWSDEDWDGERQTERYKKEKEQAEKQDNAQNIYMSDSIVSKHECN